ncbi:hypothetical protein [Labrys wisconsinensis]|uniref:Uncharacterized protein n=1 Tax=Labrys wisconsinensis TaxID=425677 RepID=A0ABU0JDH2_9HYPH|nr:hypothetical protein [Labrys wisconsinensis]MDQ0472331.1 hypothetical protein [Labrys wisconsinensis]
MQPRLRALSERDLTVSPDFTIARPLARKIWVFRWNFALDKPKWIGEFQQND